MATTQRVHAAWAVAVVAAGVLGFALHGPTDADRPHGIAPAPPTDGGRTPTQRSERRRAPRNETPVLDVAGDVAGEDVLAPLPEGDGRFVGWVSDDLYAPTPGVRITVWVDRPEAWVQPSLDTRVEERVARLALLEHWRDASRHTTVTGADGRFEIAGLPAVRHRFLAELDGYTVGRRDGNGFDSSLPDQTFDLVARPICDLRLALEGPPTVDRATVNLNGPTMDWSQTWTPARPVLKVRPGPVRLRVVTGEFGEWRSGPLEFDVPASGGPDPLRVTLREVAGVGGRVVPAEMARATRTWVTLFRTDVRAEAIDRATLRNRGELRSVESDDARFVYVDVAPGHYVLGSGRGDLPAALVRDVEIVEGTFVHLDLDTPGPVRDECLELTIEGPGGRRIDPQYVTFRYTTPSGGQSDSIGLLPGPGGTFWAPIPSGVADATGDVGVVAEHAEFDLASVTFSPCAAPTATLRFARPARVELEVTGSISDGKLSAGIYGRNGARAGLGQSAPLDASGIAVWSPIAPGAYDVVLENTYDDGSPTHVELARAALDVASGPNRVRFAVPVLHTLTVIDSTGVGGVSVVVRRDLPRYFAVVRFDAHGRAEVLHIPPGEYEVARGSKKTTITVPGTSLLEL